MFLKMFNSRFCGVSCIQKLVSTDNLFLRAGISKNRGTRKCGTSNPIEPVQLSFNCYEVVPPLRKDNVPLIIMHGLFGNKNNWSSMAKAIHTETGKTVYTLDARNHGDSPHSDYHSYIHLAEDVRKFMHDHEIEKASLVGHSMGGRALMTYAILYPHKVESLAVVDISPIGTPEVMNEMKYVFNALKAVNLFPGNYGLHDYRKVVHAQLKDLLHDDQLGQFLSMNLIDKGDGQFTWRMNLHSLISNYHPHITGFPIKDISFSGPTVFICGEKSSFVDLSKIDEIKQLFPKAFFMTIEEAGHWVHFDQPRKFLEILSVFIRRHKST